MRKNDSTDRKHHTIPMGLGAEIEDGTVRLSANAADAILLED